MPALRVVVRQGARRCAFCHSDVDRARPCAQCRTVLHEECWSIAGSCPTLGCRPVATAAASARPPEDSLVVGVLLACMSGGPVFGVYREMATRYPVIEELVESLKMTVGLVVGFGLLGATTVLMLPLMQLFG